MDSKLTRQQILNLYKGLLAASSLKGAKFAYAISRNLSYIRSFLTSNLKLSDSQIEYEKKRSDILNAEEPDTQLLDDLENEYKSTIEDTAKYLNEEVDIKLYKVKLSDVPEDIDAKIFEPILPILEEQLDK